jgi:hypothetical protein
MKSLAYMPTFVVPGDNEYNDQEDPDQAWDHWSRSAMQFHQRWDHAQFFRKRYPVSGGVQHQEARPENFVFTEPELVEMRENVMPIPGVPRGNSSSRRRSRRK